MEALAQVQGASQAAQAHLAQVHAAGLSPRMDQG